MTTEMTWTRPANLAAVLLPEERIEDTADEVLEDIQSIWPVDTGESLEGWALEVDGSGVTVSNDVEYVEYVRGGWSLAEVEFIFASAFGELELSALAVAAPSVPTPVHPSQVTPAVKRGMAPVVFADVLASKRIQALTDGLEELARKKKKLAKDWRK